MGRAKDIVVKPIAGADARRVIHSLHYSGKTKSNSQVHLGVFLDGKCGGALQFGPPNDRSRVLGLVSGTLWGEMIELNRMALADWLPRNGESRSIAMAFRLLRKTYPHLKWVLSFSDATQCGDGTIYRASGFVLTAIKRSTALYKLPNGEVIHRVAVASTPRKRRPELGGERLIDINGGTWSTREYFRRVGGEVVPGFQLRYIYFLHPQERANLTVPEMPFSAIDEAGAGMYLGEPRAPEA